jgi:hypothetical protein
LRIRPITCGLTEDGNVPEANMGTERSVVRGV